MEAKSKKKVCVPLFTPFPYVVLGIRLALWAAWFSSLSILAGDALITIPCMELNYSG